MTELFKHVNHGQRYLFYIGNCGKKSDIRLLRANFIQINNNTLLVNNVECEQEKQYNKCGILSTPLDWVVKVETLNDITHQQILLPSEIVLEIDSFV